MSNTPSHFWDPASSESDGSDDEAGFSTPSTGSGTHHAAFHTPSPSEGGEGSETKEESSEVKMKLHSRAGRHKSSKSITSMRLPVEMSDEELDDDQEIIEEEYAEKAKQDEEEKENVSISSFTPNSSNSSSLTYAFNPISSQSQTINPIEPTASISISMTPFTPSTTVESITAKPPLPVRTGGAVVSAVLPISTILPSPAAVVAPPLLSPIPLPPRRPSTVNTIPSTPNTVLPPSSPNTVTVAPATPSTPSRSQHYNTNTLKTFASTLTHNFAPISAQVQTGLYVSKRTASLLKKISLLEEDYSTGLRRSLREECAKVNKYKEDSMEKTQHAWQQTHRLLHALANTYQDNAQQVMIEVVLPLLEFYRQQEETRKEWLVEERKVSGEMAKAREDVVKSQSNCIKLLTAAKQSTQADKVKPTTTQAALLASLSKHFTKSTKSLVADASLAATRYTHAISMANIRQNKYVNEDLPRVFAGMQAIETSRIDSLKEKLLKYTQVQSQVLTNRLNIMAELQSVISQINTVDDIQTYIDNVIQDSGLITAPLPYTYDLPYTHKDIDAGRFDRNPNSIFRCSLPQVMNLQLERKWQVIPSNIPRIVVVLCESIEDKNGFNTEGIFRISASKSDLDKLHLQLDTGDYDINNSISTPHIPAGLLKEWLRLLDESLIGDDLYEKSINCMKEWMKMSRIGQHSRGQSRGEILANNNNNASADTQPSHSHSPTLSLPTSSTLPYDSSPLPASIHTGIMNIFNQLPTYNQDLLLYLAYFLGRMNSNITRMSWDNFGIVFGPSLLRCKNDDPLILLENSKYESKFTSQLFQILNQMEKEKRNKGTVQLQASSPNGKLNLDNGEVKRASLAVQGAK